MDLVKLDKVAPTTDEYDGMRGLDLLIEMAFATAEEAGWEKDPATGQPKPYNFAEKIALTHSELSEALEGDRKDLWDEKLPYRKAVEVELADACIRIFDIAHRNKLDLAAAIIEKNRFNRLRPDHKIANRAKAGGKRY